MHTLGDVLFVAVIVIFISAFFGPGAFVSTIIFALIGIFAWHCDHK